MKPSVLPCILLLTCMALTTALAQAPSVTGLMLYDAETNEPIGPLEDGAVVDLEALGTDALSVVAEAPEAASVRFAWNEQSDFQIESVAPYAIAGDSDDGRDLHPWHPPVGDHRLTITPYPEDGAGGEAGEAVAVRFSVTRGAAAAEDAAEAEDPAEAEPAEAAQAEAAPDAMDGIGRGDAVAEAEAQDAPGLEPEPEAASESEPEPERAEAAEEDGAPTDDDTVRRHRVRLLGPDAEDTVGSVLISDYDDHVVVLVSLDHPETGAEYAVTLARGSCSGDHGRAVELDPVDDAMPYAATHVATALPDLVERPHHVRVHRSAPASDEALVACGDLAVEAEVGAR